jgi:diguanylate cyclase (GGDEF)-like protein
MVDFILEHRDELPPEVREQYRSALALGHVVVGEIDEAEALLAPGDEGDECGKAFWSWLSMRCALARGDAARARVIGEQALRERAEQDLADSPYDLMELHRAVADACEQLGDTAAALACVRRSQALYEQLVGRSARARRMALQVGFDLARAQRERDRADDQRRAVEADRQRLAELNAALEVQVAENEKLQTQLREQALRDPLTGLHNRRFLFEVGPGLLERARRQGGTLAVVLLDLDHFKLLNDTYGHQAGDSVLQRFGALLAQSLRKSDVVCRHGGEEFVALMPDIDGAGAESMLERVLEAYGTEPHEHGRRRLPRCTFSAGIALFPHHGSTLEQLLSRADRALYRAKQQGRSRIEQVPVSEFSTLS